MVFDPAILWRVRGKIGLNRAVDRPAMMSRVEQGRLHLRWDLSRLSGLGLCAVASVLFGGCLAYEFEDATLAVFGSTSPVMWLCGANYVSSILRARDKLRAFCAGLS